MFSQYQEYITGGAIAIALHSPRGTATALVELAAIQGKYAYEMAKWGVRHFPAKAARDIAVRTAMSTGTRIGSRAVGVAKVGVSNPAVAVAVVGSVMASALIQKQIRQASPDAQTLMVAAYTGQHAGLPPQPLGVMM
jgi:hypothetical protein